MARKRKQSSSTFRAPRDASDIASPDFSFRLRPLSTHPRSGQVLTDIEDRRTFHPGRLRPSRTPRQVARILMAVTPKTSRRSSREVYSFKLPLSTAVCVRREIRKQVLHSKGIGGTKVRRPRRNSLSRISCKRK